MNVLGPLLLLLLCVLVLLLCVVTIIAGAEVIIDIIRCWRKGARDM